MPSSFAIGSLDLQFSVFWQWFLWHDASLPVIDKIKSNWISFYYCMQMKSCLCDQMVFTLKLQTCFIKKSIVVTNWLWLWITNAYEQSRPTLSLVQAIHLKIIDPKTAKSENLVENKSFNCMNEWVDFARRIHEKNNLKK